MPEMRFQIEWPDGSQETCYSPSLVMKKYLEPEQIYPLADFVERSRTALQIGSERVQAKFGVPCSLAMNQIREIETRASQFSQQPDSAVKVLKFIE